MARCKHTSGKRSSTPRAHLTRIYARTSPTSRNPRGHNRRNHLRKNIDMRRDPKDNLEDTFRSLLFGKYGAGDDDNGSSDNGSDLGSTSVDSEWDEETTLVEILSPPQEYNEDKVLNALKRAFAVSSHELREDMILKLLPVLNSGRTMRPAPGRDFIAGLLGFDDICKRFERDIYQSAKFDAAYAKIEEETRGLFEQLQEAYAELEDLRFAFEQEVKEEKNKMQQIIDTCPPEPEALIAKLQKTYIDRDTNKDRGSIVKGKGRERTIQGALANLKL